MSQSLIDTADWVSYTHKQSVTSDALRNPLRTNSRKPFGHSWPKWAQNMCHKGQDVHQTSKNPRGVQVRGKRAEARERLGVAVSKD